MILGALCKVLIGDFYRMGNSGHCLKKLKGDLVIGKVTKNLRMTHRTFWNILAFLLLGKQDTVGRTLTGPYYTSGV